MVILDILLCCYSVIERTRMKNGDDEVLAETRTQGLLSKKKNIQGISSKDWFWRLMIGPSHRNPR